MAQTDFSNMGLQQRLAWANSMWQVFRIRAFTATHMGNDDNSIIQRITELTRVNGAVKAVIQLVPDLLKDGTAGDNELEGNEEALRAWEQKIQYDMLRHATRNKGKLSDLRSTIQFRNKAKDVLGNFFSDRIDQMIILTATGIDFTKNNNGSTRDVTSAFLEMDFRADISAPTTNRWLRGVSGGAIAYGNTAAITANDKINYKSLVRAKAFLKETGMRGVRAGSEEVFAVWVTPQALADLRLDPDYLDAVKHAAERGGKNPIFAGASSVYVDGMLISEHNYVYNTSRAAAGSKWGAAGAVNGVACLILGAQALGFVDFGAPEWNEKEFDYGNNHGIATGKVFGMLKPKFHNDITGQVEDYGVCRIDFALSPLVTP